MKKIILDTNIFIRYLINDIPDQFKIAKNAFIQIEESKSTGIVSILVINEVIWVLEHFYNIERYKFIPKLLELLSLPKIKIIEIKKPLLIEILQEFLNSSLDFTDIYLLKQPKTVSLLTFDQQLAKKWKQ